MGPIFSLKSKIIVTAAFIAGFIVIACSTANRWYLPLPEVEVEKSDSFDADEALSYIKNITSNYQYRTFGSGEVENLGIEIGNFFLPWK